MLWNHVRSINSLMTKISGNMYGNIVSAATSARSESLRSSMSGLLNTSPGWDHHHQAEFPIARPGFSREQVKCRVCLTRWVLGKPCHWSPVWPTVSFHQAIVPFCRTPERVRDPETWLVGCAAITYQGWPASQPAFRATVWGPWIDWPRGLVAGHLRLVPMITFRLTKERPGTDTRPSSQGYGLRLQNQQTVASSGLGVIAHTGAVVPGHGETRSPELLGWAAVTFGVALAAPLAVAAAAHPASSRYVGCQHHASRYAAHSASHTRPGSAMEIQP